MGILAEKSAGVRSGVRFVPEPVRLDSEGCVHGRKYNSSYCKKIDGSVRESAVRCGGGKITFRVRCIQPGSATYPLIRSVIYPGIPNSRRLATIGLPEPSTSTGHKTTVGITCLPAKVWRVQCRLRFDHRMRLMVRVPLIRWSLLVAERWKLLGRIQFQLFAGPATHAGAKSQRDAPRAGLRRRVPSPARLPTFAES